MYWPYVKYGKKNYKIPKWWKDASDLTLEDCLNIIWNDINKEKWTKPTKKVVKKKNSKK